MTTLSAFKLSAGHRAISGARLRGGAPLAALALGCGLAGPALAQDGSAGLSEIIVTAQKREQSLQDVPVAVTALGAEALSANRVTSVVDLSGLAPGLTTAATAGGTKVPQFSMRGTTGNGVVPGSDRQVGIYIDGVYIAASRGAIFDLPDISRIEVLRGPQGTLFGRNATAGAVSITTREPKGEMGVKATATVGNYDQYRFGVSIDLPQIGPFSAYASYLHNERRGDIRNTAAGMMWNRNSSRVARIARVLPAVKYLGNENADSFFAAVKFESGDFATVYRYDRLTSIGSPPGTGFVGYNPAAPLVGNVLSSLIASQPFAVPMTPSGRRPDAVANGYVVESPQRGEGHSVTSTLRISDSLTVKNIFAHRKSFIFGSSPLDGISALTFTSQAVGPLATMYGISALSRQGVNVADPANAALVQATIGNIAGGLRFLVGSPFVAIVNQTQGRTSQISDEVQLNYDSELVTATLGGLWFNAKDRTAENFQQNTPSFVVFPGGVIPNANIGRTFNEITSLAAYAQLELHATDQIDIVAGARVTRDKKSGSFLFGPNPGALSTLVSSYKKTRPNYLLGINYKPNADTLVYAKFSTAFVSGGSTSGVTYVPETAESWEAGVKATLFDNRLQANLAVYRASYKNVQGANSTTTPGMADVVNTITGDPNRSNVIGTFTFNNGDLTAKGFELDFTARPVSAITMGGSLGYNDSKFKNVNPLILAANFGRYEQTFLPDWTANVWAQYDSPSIGGGDAHVSVRFDGRWQSRMLLKANPDLPEFKTWAAGIRDVPAYWVFNGRIALKDLDLGGVRTELAAWGRNLTDNRSANYALNLGVIAGANYIPARTYGLDLTVQF